MCVIFFIIIDEFVVEKKATTKKNYAQNHKNIIAI